VTSKTFTDGEQATRPGPMASGVFCRRTFAIC
jgi:hypothetical protein